MGKRAGQPLQSAVVTKRVGRLRLNDGAVVDEVVSEPGDGVRLRLAQCPDPVFLFPLPIEWVSTAEDLDRSFGSSGYRTIDIYRDKAKHNFNRINLIYKYVFTSIVAISSGEISAAERFYVRAYIGAHCEVNETALVGWAKTVVAYRL